MGASLFADPAALLSQPCQVPHEISRNLGRPFPLYQVEARRLPVTAAQQVAARAATIEMHSNNRPDSQKQ
jgi:hypothetical protein